jgi:hypothetical protein
MDDETQRQHLAREEKRRRMEQWNAKRMAERQVEALESIALSLAVLAEKMSKP